MSVHDPHSLSRRSALKLLSANVALIASGCGKPPEEIVPYVHMPERVLPGIPLQFASTLPLGGYGRGVLCTSVTGRPIKVSGNPLHPASLGATDVFAEAEVFSLYDPDRSQTVRQRGEIAAWVALQTALMPRFAEWATTQGRGLRLLTGPLTSPTALRQIAALKAQYPAMRWHVDDPLADEAAREGAVAAFGRSVTPLPRWSDLDILVTLDADPLGPGPAQVANARGFSDRRRARRGSTQLLRLYAIEAAPTLTGLSADNRLTWPLDRIEAATVALARVLGADLPDPGLPPTEAAQVVAIAQDLQDRRGLVVPGPSLRPEIHALAHWINARIAAPLDLVAPAASGDAGTLAELVRDLQAGAVDTLLVANCNPVYDAPPSLKVAEAISKARLGIHLGQHRDETSDACTWHVAQSHPLESWSDLRAVDGTASLVQPLIRPLYVTRSLHAMLAAFGGDFAADDRALVRDTWRERAAGSDFEAWWRKVLEDGVIPGTASPVLALPSPALPRSIATAPSGSATLLIRPDPCLWDGSPANNAWLQECPRPLTKEVWGNALGLGPADAAGLAVKTGDLLRLTAGDASLTVPAFVLDGHAPGTFSLTTGHGRSRAGSIGDGVGVSAHALTGQGGRFAVMVEVARDGGRGAVHTTQDQFRLEGEDRDLYPTLTLEGLANTRPDDPKGPVPTMLPEHDYTGAAARWAMVIDAGACIGCNACVLACQAENNVPVVGPEEIDRHRDMHWLRIDRYDFDTGGHRQGGFQPVPCMHCETAPCEPVCPVGASVHDSEGLNVQVYNRCIGTRFCQANCPYKVRRFNFFGYAGEQAYGDLGSPVMQAHNNPNVSVRARGVMEKCTYCVQRISGARRAAEKENRPLGPNDVTTACQSACPTLAISFGNLNAPGSTVGGLREEPHHYALLDHLNTKPRTTYLAAVRDPNPVLGGPSVPEGAG